MFFQVFRNPQNDVFNDKYKCLKGVYLYLPFVLDINECEPVSPCHANATCNNTDGSFNCTCNDGYTGDGFTCDG